jgi:hypothetical protein
MKKIDYFAARKPACSPDMTSLSFDFAALTGIFAVSAAVRSVG